MVDNMPKSLIGERSTAKQAPISIPDIGGSCDSNSESRQFARIKQLYSKVVKEPAESVDQEKEKNLLLQEVVASLSTCLQDEVRSNGVEYQIQHKKLDLEELFGVNGFLAIFVADLISQPSLINKSKLTLNIVCDDDGLANVAVCAEGNPLDLTFILLARDRSILRARGLKTIQIEGKKICAVDDLYQSFYDKAQNSEINFKEAVQALAQTAKQYAQELFDKESYEHATKFIRSMLRIRGSILGESHLLTIECRQQLAFSLLEQEQTQEAISLLESNVLFLVACHENNVQENLRADGSLCTAYRRIGETERARKMLKEALKSAKKELGEEHQVTQMWREESVELTKMMANEKDAELDELVTKSKTTQICDPKAFEYRLAQENDKENNKTLTGLKNITLPKRLPKISAEVFAEIERIGAEQPNFAEVTEMVINALHTQSLTGRAAQLPPMLLVGPPGVGKTRYLKRIAAALDLPFSDVQLAGVSDAYKISGLSRYWGTAGEGAVASIFNTNDVANPIFLFDEIDKTRKDEKSDPLAVILLLLEKESSRTFKDSFVGVPMDVSHSSFIATANSIEQLPEPLLSRFVCIDIEPLDFEGRRTMIKTIYAELIEQEGLAGFLESELPEVTLERLALCESLTGRELKREMLAAMQRTCREYTVGQACYGKAVLPSKLKLPESKVKRSIGFMS